MLEEAWAAGLREMDEETAAVRIIHNHGRYKDFIKNMNEKKDSKDRRTDAIKK